MRSLRKMNRTSREDGYTLLELMISVGVIGVLSMVMLGVFMSVRGDTVERQLTAESETITSEIQSQPNGEFAKTVYTFTAENVGTPGATLKLPGRSSSNDRYETSLVMSKTSLGSFDVVMTNTKPSNRGRSVVSLSTADYPDKFTPVSP